MSDTGLRLAKHFAGAGVALALFLGMSAAAEARGIVADMGTLMPTQTTFDGLTVNAYSDGAISIGALSPTNYFDAGLFDYSMPGYSISMQEFGLNIGDPSMGDPKLAIIWAFTDTATGSPLGGKEGVFGITLRDNLDGTFTVFSGVGVSTVMGTWGYQYYHANGYCDATCDGSDGNPADGEVGVYLPGGAEQGFSYNGHVFDTLAPVSNCPSIASDPSVCSYTDYSFTFTPQTDTTVSVPEPADWSIMLFGLSALGLLIRQSRRRGLLKTRV